MRPNVRLNKLRFPGPAGDHQARRALPELVEELGGNYARYHEFLRLELEKVDTDPQPGDFPTIESYLEAWAWIQDIVKAEALLRNCRAHRKTGRALDAAIDKSLPPLVDEKRRLVSAEDDS